MLAMEGDVPSLRVCIVGGGIGGLTLAGLLQADGHAVTVLERTPAWAPVGAGIVLAPNAMRVASALGIRDRLQARGFLPDGTGITDASGASLSRIDSAEAEDRFGGLVALHRAILHEELLGCVDDSSIRLGTSVTEVVTDGDQALVVDTDGQRERYDVVVGADGIRSAVRDLAFGPNPPTYSGYTCWRFVVEHEQHIRAVTEMWGRGRRFGIVPIESGRAYCFATSNEPARQEDPDGERITRFQRRFAGFGGHAPAMLAALTDDAQLLRGDIEEVVQDGWSRGRVALIGDAAHALTPNMGQGAGMAMEDALVLSRCLASEDVNVALRGYESLRRARVEWVRSRSRQIGRVGQWSNPIACWVRGALMKMVPPRVAAGGLIKLVDEAP